MLENLCSAAFLGNVQGRGKEKIKDNDITKEFILTSRKAGLILLAPSPKKKGREEEKSESVLLRAIVMHQPL